MTTVSPISFLTPSEYTSAPLQVRMSARLETDPETLFAVVSEHETWTSWFPVLTAVTIDHSQAAEAGGTGTVRHCTLDGGVQLVERIVGFSQNQGFGYMIEDGNPMGVSGHLAVVDLQPDAAGGTRLAWFQYFDHPDAVSFQPQVVGMLSGGFHSLIDRFGGELLETSFG